MKTRLLNLCSIVSLVLLWGVLALIVQSYTFPYSVSWQGWMSPLEYELSSAEGDVSLMVTRQFAAPPGTPTAWQGSSADFLGVRVETMSGLLTRAAHAKIVMIFCSWWTWPLALTLAASVPSARHLLRQRRLRRKQRIGKCPSCGYDLRSTPTPGQSLLARCPECGHSSAPARP